MGREDAPCFLCAERSYASARVALLGCPFDGAASFRKGARLGPEAMRSASESLESYSPRLDKDLSEVSLCDLGDLDLSCDAIPSALASIRAAAAKTFRDGKRLIALGGDHSVSLPLVQAALEFFPELIVFQWDAHADLREAYLGERLSHACVARRILNLGGVGGMYQFGVRSGTREEFRWMRANGTMRPLTPQNVESALEDVGARAVYITIDVDVLDPAEVPGTTNPEPGGVRFAELSDCLLVLNDSGAQIIGADVVELTPEWDASGASAIAAAKIVRELALALSG